MKRVELTIKGDTPLMMHAVPPKVLEGLRTGARVKREKDLTPEKIAEQHLYKDDAGNIGIPASCVFATLRSAGRYTSFSGKKNISTANSTLLPSFLFIKQDFFPLNNGSDWVPDQRRGRNPNGGEMICIVRPKFNEWSFDVIFEFDEKQIEEGVVKQLFKNAGTKIGLCSFRPACNGTFGQFHVENWKTSDSK